MASINISADLDCEQFHKYSKVWDEETDVNIIYPSNLSESEIRKLFDVLTPLLPNSFSATILSDLAEMPNTPIDLLEELLDKGDTGCKMAICLRDDLPKHLLHRCLKLDDINVREHLSFIKKNGKDTKNGKEKK